MFLFGNNMRILKKSFSQLRHVHSFDALQIASLFILQLGSTHTYTHTHTHTRGSGFWKSLSMTETCPIHWCFMNCYIIHFYLDSTHKDVEKKSFYNWNMSILWCNMNCFIIFCTWIPKHTHKDVEKVFLQLRHNPFLDALFISTWIHCFQLKNFVERKQLKKWNKNWICRYQIILHFFWNTIFLTCNQSSNVKFTMKILKKSFPQLRHIHSLMAKQIAFIIITTWIPHKDLEEIFLQLRHVHSLDATQIANFINRNQHKKSVFILKIAC
jgi:hypothetical protein